MEGCDCTEYRDEAAGPVVRYDVAAQCGYPITWVSDRQPAVAIPPGIALEPPELDRSQPDHLGMQMKRADISKGRGQEHDV